MTDPDRDRCHLLPDDGTGQPIRYHGGPEPLSPEGEEALRHLIAAARRDLAALDPDGELAARQEAAVRRIRERSQLLQAKETTMNLDEIDAAIDGAKDRYESPT